MHVNAGTVFPLGNAKKKGAICEVPRNWDWEGEKEENRDGAAPSSYRKEGNPMMIDAAQDLPRSIGK